MSSPAVERHLISLLQPRSFEAEQYRVLRHIIEQGHNNGGLHVVAVTSATVGDGKTTTAINLAGALAQDATTRVVLIDADLRRGAVATGLRLPAPEATGLVDVILDPAASLSHVVRVVPGSRLAVVPAGRCPAAPYEMLKSPRLGELIREAGQRYDYVVVDTPPLVPVPDARVIEQWVDGFLLVVRAHHTPRRVLEEALNMVSPAKLVGLVFNADHGAESSHYRHYASYYHPSPNGHHATVWKRVAARARQSFMPRPSSNVA